MQPDRIVEFVNGNKLKAIAQYSDHVVLLDEYDAVAVQSRIDWDEYRKIE